MSKYILILSLTIFTFAYPIDYSQKKAIERIIKYAKQYPDNKGYNYKTLLVAISYIESSFCKNTIGDVKQNKSILEASLGCFQFQIKTAKFIINNDNRLKKYRKWSDWKIANHLISDLEFQTMLASYYIQYIIRHYGYLQLWRYNGSKRYNLKLKKAIPLATKVIKK